LDSFIGLETEDENKVTIQYLEDQNRNDFDKSMDKCIEFLDDLNPALIHHILVCGTVGSRFDHTM
jgi:thiamine pyrophosphokinase